MKRRWLLWLLVIVFLWVVISHFAEIRNLAEILVQGKWQWVLAAALLQIVYYLMFTAMYQSAFDAAGVCSRLGDLLPVTFASIFVNVAAPLAGASGVALFVDDAAQRGQSAARASTGTILVLVTDYSAFLLIFVAGLINLSRRHALKGYEIAGGLALLVITGGLAAVLVLGLVRAAGLHRLLDGVQRAVNGVAGWFRRGSVLGEDWGSKNAGDFAAAATAIAAHPLRVGRTFIIALAMHLVGLLSLYVLFLAFYQPIGLGVLVAGFAMGTLFWIIAITPQGIGVVEGVMALVYSSLHVPAAKATAIALAYRGLSLWLPLAIGFILLRRIRSFGARVRSGTPA
jgi:uncharacterized protein (TIRG00374 family)